MATLRAYVLYAYRPNWSPGVHGRRAPSPQTPYDVRQQSSLHRWYAQLWARGSWASQVMTLPHLLQGASPNVSRVFNAFTSPTNFCGVSMHVEPMRMSRWCVCRRGSTTGQVAQMSGRFPGPVGEGAHAPSPARIRI